MTVHGQHRLDAIRDQVRAGGRRWTVAKSAIVTALLDADRHLSVRRIHQAVLPRYPEIDQSTIYRVVQTLAEEHVIHAVEHGGKVRYGLSDRPHHHAVCARCGQDADLPAQTMRGLLTEAETETGFRFDGQPQSLLGLCPRCLSQPAPIDAQDTDEATRGAEVPRP